MAFQPAIALFLFDWDLLAIALWLVRGGLVSRFVPRPHLRPYRPQRGPILAEGLQQMHQCPASGAVVQRPGPFHLTVRAGEIQFGGVWDKDRDLLGSDPLLRLFIMRIEDPLGEGLLVIEEAVSSLRLGLAAAGRRDAGGRVLREVRQDPLQPVVEPLVSEVDVLHLVHNPGC